MTTTLEYEARTSTNCMVCRKAKEQGSMVCWDCFKGRNGITALKYFDGTFEQWLKIAQKQIILPLTEAQRVKLEGRY